RPAEADRGHGRGSADVPERAGIPARGYAGGEGRRAPALHADDRGAARSRHRRFARRATRQDTLLERVQTTRPLVGRAASVLGAPRLIAFGSLAFAAFWFLNFFEALSWVVLVACIVPWVDAYSVWRGPTNHIVHNHHHVFSTLSFAFPVPGEDSAANLGLPDLLFFSLFLAAAARFGLRMFATWVLLVASFGTTIAIAVAWNKPGL